MQIDQTQAIRQYRAVMQSAQAAESVESTAEKDVSQAAKPSAGADRVELSADASVWKMSEEDRAALVKSLKEDQKNQMDRFMNMMAQAFQTQGITAATAGSDAFWQMFASGNLTVDADTKAAAQQAISEDGYWGVKQTSQRIFDMAAALAGDNVELMQKLQAAVGKGFEQAGVAWGGKLPSITDDTRDAIDKLFDGYYEQNRTESADQKAPVEQEAPAEAD